MDENTGSNKLSRLSGILPTVIAAIVAINTNKSILKMLGFDDTLTSRIIAGIVIFAVIAVGLAVAFTIAASAFRPGKD